MRTESAKRILLRLRDESLQCALDAARQAASLRAEGLYLVGGCVRDLLRDVPLRDLDLVVEGDPKGLGEDIARRIGGRASALTPFQTCTIQGPDELRIDLAMSRRERYAGPAALPRVAPAPIEEDLLRRDFTVNSLAIALTGPQRSRLLDPAGGRADLRERRLRPHHRATLVDDPTRAFRGARYAVRLRLRSTALWREALRAAARAGSFQRLGAARLRRELALIWTECEPAAALQRCHRWGLLEYLQPRLAWGPGLDRVIRRAAAFRTGSHPAGPDLLFASLAWSLPAPSRRALARRLELRGAAQRRLLEAASAPARAERLLGSACRLPDPTAFRRMELVARWSHAEVQMAEAAAKAPVRRRLREYRSTWRLQVPHLKGDDLVAMGVPRGPRIGSLLRRLHAARIAGQVTSRAEEIAFVRRQIEGDSQS